MKIIENIKKSSKLNIVRVCAFILIIFLVPIGIFFSKKESISYDENRVLSEMPKLSVNSWLSKDFMNGTSDYLSDHFIFREQFVSVKNKSESVLGKNEINGILNVEGSLVQIFRNPDKNRQIENISAINKFTEKTKANTLLCLAPTAQHYYQKLLPIYAYQTDENGYISSCYKSLKTAKSVDIGSSLTADRGEYLYYRTDHHWTENGAYNAYLALQNYLGYKAYSKSAFNISVMSSSFRGTLYSKTLDKSIITDNIINYTLKKDEPTINITDENGKVLNKSLYYQSRLKEKDQYSYFLGGNKGVINVENKDTDSTSSLLLIKDSYANSLVPFLSKHYKNITVVDLRYATIDNLKEIIAADYNQTLILYNVLGFFEETTLTKLKFIN